MNPYRLGLIKQCSKLITKVFEGKDYMEESNDWDEIERAMEEVINSCETLSIRIRLDKHKHFKN